MRHQKGREQRAVHCDQRRDWRVSAERSYLEPGVLDPGDQHWLEAMADAVLILSPVHDRRRYLTDFRVDYANAATAELTGDSGAERVEAGSLVGANFLSMDDVAGSAFF